MNTIPWDALPENQHIVNTPDENTDDITERGFYMVVVTTSYPWGDMSAYRYERTLDTYADAEDFIMERENVTGYMETWTILHYAPVPF